MKKVQTLCIVHQHPRVLLGMKKRGFGTGRWNGFGGKLQEGETVEEAAKRECLEEAGITIREMTPLGVLDFEFVATGEVLEVHIFKVIEFEGEPREGEEMKPQWFEIADIPFKDMWPDDRYWMPLFLKDRRFRGTFQFNNEGTIVNYDINPL